MNRPKLFIHIDHESFWENTRLTLMVIIGNSLMILTLIAGVYLYLSSESMNVIINKYHDAMQSFFYIPNRINITNFIKYSIIYTPAMEEFIYRYPVYALLKHNFWMKYKLTWPVLLVIALSLNWIWASSHTIFLPIFITGLPLYWLIYKTKAIWPVVACHAAFNALLYIFVQSLLSLNILMRSGGDVIISPKF